MFLTQTASHIFDALLALAYPQACAICNRSIENRSLAPACDDCWRATRIFTGTEAMCSKCGVLARDSRQSEHDEIYCRRCDSHLFSAARACGLYEGALRESVLLLKRQPHLSSHLRSLLVGAAQRAPLNAANRIIPVPLHSEREERRGFNQASLIAHGLASSLGVMVDESSLVRVMASDKYRAGLDAKGRLDTVEDAFSVRFPRLIEGEVVLLIDDVFTTGATASSCAAALFSAGAKSVFVLTIARPA
jgi:competence protein ComFC